MGRVAFTPKTIGVRVPMRRNPFAAARLSGLGAFGALGDDSSQLASLGFSPSQISLVISKYNDGSLSAQGYQFLLGGGLLSPSDDQLTDFFNQDPGAPDQQSTSSKPAPTTSQQAGVPTGAIVTYQGTWTTSNTKTASDLISQVSGSLSGNGLQVVGTSNNAGFLANQKFIGIAESGQQFGVTLQLQVTGAGFAQASDVASIVNGLVYQASGKMPISGSAAVTAMPGGTAATITGTPQSLTAWLEGNATWLLLGAGALIVLSRSL